MTKNTVKLLMIFLAVFLIGCAQNSSKALIKTQEKTIPVNIEIADESDERAKGLMYRTYLGKNSGMLFVFDSEDYYSFWMKNTLIALDMVFISESGKIVDIKYAVPCLGDSCPSYTPSAAAKYVLEVNGNFTTRNNVNVGDGVEIRI